MYITSHRIQRIERVKFEKIWKNTNQRPLSWPTPCAHPEGGQGSEPPEKSQNIWCLSNIDPDPLKNHKATKPAFNVDHHRRADDGPAYSGISICS